MPKLIVFVSVVAPPTVADVASWYSSGVPNWYGHQSAGLVTCSAGNAAGVNEISRRSVAFSVTVWLTVSGVNGDFVIVPVIVVVTGAAVVLKIGTPLTL